MDDCIALSRGGSARTIQTPGERDNGGAVDRRRRLPKSAARL